jgi:peptidoglycan/LPS O-acetylase OafA/YrhL
LLLDERRDTGEIGCFRFWWRRGLRILPLYYGVLGLFVLHAALLPASPLREHFFASLPAFATGTTNWFVSYRVAHPVLFGFSWSLATELEFYLVWPLLLVLARTPRRALVLLLAMLVVDQAAERGLFASFLAPRGVSAGIVTSFSASLGFGSLLALGAQDEKLGPWLVRTLTRRGVFRALTLLALGLVVWPRGPFWAFELVLASLVASAALGPASAAPLLTVPALARVGRLSYAMYLFHVPVIGGVRRLLPSLSAEPLIVFPVALALTVALAELSARWVEGPLLALRNPPWLFARLSRLRTG